MVRVLGERGYLGSVVKRRWAEMGWDGDYVVNCIRPDDLALVPGSIVPSTDAIAEDSAYAATKREVERLGRVVIRAGIVDIRHTYPVAYLDWYCNPLTPLEWADVAWRHRDEPGVHATGRETLTRYDVARYVADVFGRPSPRPVRSGSPLDRVQPNTPRPPLREALVEFREWLAAGAERERLATGHA